MEPLPQKQLAAAQEFVDHTLVALKTERGVHAATAVAAAGWMAGSFLLRSFRLPLAGITPGQLVLCPQANEQGPELLGVLSDAIARCGVEVDRAAAAGGAGGGDAPTQTLLEIQRVLGPSFRASAARHELSERQAAEASAVAAALILRQTAEALDPSAAFGLAVRGIVEGSKTAPDPAML